MGSQGKLNSFIASSVAVCPKDLPDWQLITVQVPQFVAKEWRDLCRLSAEQEADVGQKLGVIRYTANASDTQGPSQAKSGPKFQLHLDSEFVFIASKYNFDLITIT